MRQQYQVWRLGEPSESGLRESQRISLFDPRSATTRRKEGCQTKVHMVAGSVLSDLEAWRPKTPFHRIIVPVASFVLILFVSLHYALSANAGPSLIVEEKQGDGTRARGLINAYFDAWNKHDVEGLRTLLAHDCKLTDWETQVSGRDAVVEANRKIFEKMPEVKIQVLATHLFKGEKSATCEILVKTGKEDLNVADIIIIESNKIKAIRAYKK